MKTKLTSQTDTEAKFTLSLDETALQPYVTQTFDRLRGRVRAKGFRPGKAPNAIVERELGTSVVQGEVMETAVEACYLKAIREQELVVVAPPQISLQKFVPYTELECEVTVELLPKVTVGDYQAIRLPRPPIKLDTAEIERTIEDLRRREASRVEGKQPAKLGDEVTFDFKGTQKGEPVRGASAENHTLQLGSGQFIPGFEDELVGLKVGDEKTFKITFPKDYHEPDLRGQVVEFEVKIRRVVELVLPEISDDFAASVGPFQTVAELRADISQRLKTSQAEASARQYENQVLDEVLKHSTYKLPASLVKEQLERLEAELTQNLAYSGLDIDKYLQMSGKSRSDLETEMRPEAERRVALALVLTEVARAEDIRVTDGELDAELTRLKLQYSDPATQKELEQPAARNDIYNHLMSTRVLTKLTGYAEQN